MSLNCTFKQNICGWSLKMSDRHLLSKVAFRLICKDKATRSHTFPIRDDISSIMTTAKVSYTGCENVWQSCCMQMSSSDQWEETSVGKTEK